MSAPGPSPSQYSHARQITPGPPCTRRATESDLGPLTPQRETVTLVYAIKVDDECINRWGEALYDTLYPGSRDELSPDELRKKLDHWLIQWRIVIRHRRAHGVRGVLQLSRHTAARPLCAARPQSREQADVAACVQG